MVDGIGASDCHQDSDQTNSSCFSLKRLSPIWKSPRLSDFYINIYELQLLTWRSCPPSITPKNQMALRGEITTGNPSCTWFLLFPCTWFLYFHVLNPLKQENGKNKRSRRGVSCRVCLGSCVCSCLGLQLLQKLLLALALCGSSPDLPADPGDTSFNLVKNSGAEGLISVPGKALDTIPCFQGVLDHPVDIQALVFSGLAFFPCS